MKRIFVKLSFLLFLFAVLHSCKSPEIIIESTKDFNGTWKLDKVMRNSEDITSRVSPEQFEITFQTNDHPEPGLMGTYQFTDGAPFVVRNSGIWSLNDPQYPFTLYLREEGGTYNIPVQFYFPAKEGRNQMQLLFSPGCESNKYEYFLRKVD